MSERGGVFVGRACVRGVHARRIRIPFGGGTTMLGSLIP